MRVAVMGFSPYPWSAPLNDIPVAAALVRRAAKKADIVIVLMHAGAEGANQTHTPIRHPDFLGEDRGNVRAFAHAMVKAGADLVLGSGPHVIRGIERYRNRLIAYSLGNFAGWRNFALGGNLSLSGLLTVRIDGAGRILGGRWTSLCLAPPGVPQWIAQTVGAPREQSLGERFRPHLQARLAGLLHGAVSRAGRGVRRPLGRVVRLGRLSMLLQEPMPRESQQTFNRCRALNGWDANLRRLRIVGAIPLNTGVSTAEQALPGGRGRYTRFRLSRPFQMTTTSTHRSRH